MKCYIACEGVNSCQNMWSSGPFATKCPSGSCQNGGQSVGFVEIEGCDGSCNCEGTGFEGTTCQTAISTTTSTSTSTTTSTSTSTSTSTTATSTTASAAASATYKPNKSSEETIGAGATIEVDDDDNIVFTPGGRLINPAHGVLCGHQLFAAGFTVCDT